MKTFLKPYWIFLTISIPQAVLLFLFGHTYWIIDSQLNPENIFYWKTFGVISLFLFAALTTYGTVLILKRKKVHYMTGIVVLVCYIPLLYMFMMKSHRMIPFSVPRWVMPQEDLLMYPFTFLMPAFAFALLQFVLWLTPDEKEHRQLINFIGILIIPALWYVIIHVVLPSITHILDDFFRSALLVHGGMVLLIVSTLIFLFFFLRFIYLMLKNKLPERIKESFLLRSILTVFLPLFALAVYNGVLLPGVQEIAPGFLGNWSHPVYYIVLLINGILLIVPPVENRTVRIAVFCAKSFLYSLIFYSFIVLLPFLPLSVILIVAVGFGFLMLTPLILMIVQTRSIAQDYRFLTHHFNRYLVAACLIISFLAIPTGVTVSFLRDRSTLHSMLGYVYKPDYGSNIKFRVSMSSAWRVIDTIKSSKRSISILRRDRKPYITPFYHWLVMDNLTLSNDKIRLLERLFFGESNISDERNRVSRRTGVVPRIASIRTESKTVNDSAVTRSWIHLDIKNGSERQQEYVSSISIPEGVWISDYYLRMNGEDVHGLLTEKKSATWVFQQITRRSKDPGIIYYTDDGRIIMRVFPFEPNETRTTGFELLHRGPVTIEIDGHTVSLEGKEKDLQENAPIALLDGGIIAVSPKAKKALETYQRTPYMHFIIDMSSGNEARISDYISRINRLIDRKPVGEKDALLTLANYEVITMDLADDWEARTKRFPVRGGFFLERAFKSVLFENYTNSSRKYPVFIVVSDNLPEAIFPDGMNAFRITFPETDLFYELARNGDLNAHSMIDDPSYAVLRNVKRIPSRLALAWPDTNNPRAFLADNGETGIVVSTGNLDLRKPELNGDTWEHGAALRGMWYYLNLYPSKTGNDWTSIVRNSFSSHIMTTLSSFIVVENKAQEKALLEKQAKVLSADRSLDIGEEDRMTEPPLLVLAALLIMFLYFRTMRRNRKGQRWNL